MLRALALAAALLLAPATVAFAAEPDEAAQAEYVRLSSEMKRIAEKNAWEGVELTWEKLQATGVAPQYEDWFLAAQAARSAGNVSAARDRLVAANELREEREVMDWLWEIDSSYGKVHLQSDVGTLPLEPEEMPFHPDRAAAVRYAQDGITETGSFEGYLPEGRYTFGTYEVVVVPRVQTVQIDARGSQDVPKPPRPEPEPGGNKSPYTLGGQLGVGNNYGAWAGAGIQLVFRPGSGVFGISAGGGFDFEWMRPGFSAYARVYPHKNIFIGAGVAPLIWYRGDVAGVGVAHGPAAQAGVDFLFGPVLIDANFTAGVAPAVGKFRGAIGGGVGIGTKFF